jgi:phosphatidylserine decarboxylase
MIDKPGPIDKNHGHMSRIQVRSEVIPFLVAALVVCFLVALILRACGVNWAKAGGGAGVLAVVLVSYLVYFFRDPERQPPADRASIVAGADGYVAAITNVSEKEFLKTDAVRISIFLTLFDVHVNRAPIGGKIRFLQYYPGKRYFTFQEKSSEFNQHNSIFIEGKETRCLVNQIVGPVARRVVYWLALDQEVNKGDRIGMMKFGSRLDMYFPATDVDVMVRKGEKVKAGETVVAILRKKDHL